MRFDAEVTIHAPAHVVWRVYTDVERWSEWTESIRSLRYVEGDRLAIGARVRTQQPKLPSAVWEVTALEPGRAWTWESAAPGIRTSAIHELAPVDEHTTLVRQAIVQSGPLGAVFGFLYAGLTRRYLAMEGAGLKQRCEADRPA